jgi:DICT domain-containing protein
MTTDSTLRTFFESIFRDPVADLETHCNKIATASPGDVREIAHTMLQMLVGYYRDVRWQALLSFLAAFVLELIAVVLFFMASHKAINHEIDSATVMALSGAGVQIMTAVVFYFYAQSARQFAGFHICLDRTNRFLLTNAILENLPEGPDRNAKRGEVVTSVLNAAMPTPS